MRAFISIVLVIQVLTFVTLGVFFCARGDVRIGVAQLLLAVVQAVIYSAGVH